MHPGRLGDQTGGQRDVRDSWRHNGTFPTPYRRGYPRAVGKWCLAMKQCGTLRYDKAPHDDCQVTVLTICIDASDG